MDFIMTSTTDHIERLLTEAGKLAAEGADPASLVTALAEAVVHVAKLDSQYAVTHLDAASAVLAAATRELHVFHALQGRGGH
jgi:hypothetical protein